MEEPILRYLKVADKPKNKIVIPMPCIKKFGKEYYLEVYEDYIKLIPVKKEK